MDPDFAALRDFFKHDLYPSGIMSIFISNGGEDNKSHDPTLLNDDVTLGLLLLFWWRAPPNSRSYIFCIWNQPESVSITVGRQPPATPAD